LPVILSSNIIPDAWSVTAPGIGPEPPGIPGGRIAPPPGISPPPGIIGGIGGIRPGRLISFSFNLP